MRAKTHDSKKVAAALALAYEKQRLELLFKVYKLPETHDKIKALTKKVALLKRF